MKKLYSVLASAALVLTATAANQATLAGIVNYGYPHRAQVDPA